MADVHRVKVSFRIGAWIHTNPPGALPDATVVTTTLGIQPSHAHNPGDRKSDRAAPWKHGQWRLESTLPGTAELEAHLRSLLDQLLPVRDKIQELLDTDLRLKADFFCGLWIENYNEGVVLSPETLRGIASCGATLGLDIYRVEQTERESPDSPLP